VLTFRPRHVSAVDVISSVFKGVNLTGLLGDIKEDWESGGRKSPAGSWGGAQVGSLGDKVTQNLKLFCGTTHNICIKIQQTTVVAVTG